MVRSKTGDGATRVRRPRRRLLITAIIIAVVLALLVTAEFVTRAVVSRIAADEVAKALPQGVSARIHATSGGACVLCEVSTRRLSNLKLSTEDLTVGEISGVVFADLSDIRLGDPVEVGALAGTIRMSSKEVNEVLATAAERTGLDIRTVEFGKDELRYRTTIDMFGRQVDLLVAAKVRIRAGGYVRIEATELRLEAGGVGSGFDTEAQLVSFDACIAEFIPDTLELTDVEVTERGLSVGVRSKRPFDAAEESFTTLGKCE